MLTILRKCDVLVMVLWCLWGNYWSMRLSGQNVREREHKEDLSIEKCSCGVSTAWLWTGVVGSKRDSVTMISKRSCPSQNTGNRTRSLVKSRASTKGSGETRSHASHGKKTSRLSHMDCICNTVTASGEQYENLSNASGHGRSQYLRVASISKEEEMWRRMIMVDV
jgi:hypothetical protein